MRISGHNFIVMVDLIIFLFPFHIYFYDYLECMCKARDAAIGSVCLLSVIHCQGISSESMEWIKPIILYTIFCVLDQ